MVIASEWLIYVVSALCQRVWAQSSAGPHSSYRPNCLTSAWHHRQLPCPLPLRYQQKLAKLGGMGESERPPTDPLPDTHTHSIPNCLPTRLTTRRHDEGDGAAQSEPFKRSAAVALSDPIALLEERSQGSHTSSVVAAFPSARSD